MKTWARGFGAAITVLAAACLDKGGAPAATEVSTTEVGPSSSAGATTEATGGGSEPAGSSSSEGSSGDGGCHFLDCPKPEIPCRFRFMGEDCPEGQKCVMWSEYEGFGWQSLRCAPIDPNPGKVGEPCTLVTGPGGGDSCELGAFCWEVWGGEEVGHVSTCLSLCGGDWEKSYECPTAMIPLNPYRVFDLCVCWPSCDPFLGSGCADDEVCVYAETFLCVLDDLGDAGAYGDACALSNACAPGLGCIPAGNVPGCEGDSCCSYWCQTEVAYQPDSDNEKHKCPGDGTVCINWYNESYYIAPVGSERLGICALPP